MLPQSIGPAMLGGTSFRIGIAQWPWIRQQSAYPAEVLFPSAKRAPDSEKSIRKRFDMEIPTRISMLGAYTRVLDIIAFCTPGNSVSNKNVIESRHQCGCLPCIALATGLFAGERPVHDILNTAPDA